MYVNTEYNLQSQVACMIIHKLVYYHEQKSPTKLQGKI